MWRETIVPKYKDLLAELNKGGTFTYEMVRVAVTTGNPNIQEQDDRSFMSIWEQVIHDLKTNDNGARFKTGQNYESALHSFRAIMGDDAIKGFDISGCSARCGNISVKSMPCSFRNVRMSVIATRNMTVAISDTMPSSSFGSSLPSISL